MGMLDRLSCTTPKYDTLYARWLQNPGVLLDLGLYTPRLRLLDLCGGTGAVSHEAWNRGGHRITLVDLNPRCTLRKVRQIRGRAEELTQLISNEFDLVVCRQAIGYLDLEKAFAQVAWSLAPYGRFVFNSFSNPPRAALKRYTYEGRRYLEASARLFGRVCHLQASPEVGADLSLFRYHREETILKYLRPWFDVDKYHFAHSIRWNCRRLT